MNITIVKNKYLNAFLVLLLFLAASHFILLSVFALSGQGWHQLNCVRILEVDRYFPFFDSFAGDVVSFLISGGLYLAILLLNKKN